MNGDSNNWLSKAPPVAHFSPRADPESANVAAAVLSRLSRSRRASLDTTDLIGSPPEKW
jgi:hypothetical protein